MFHALPPATVGHREISICVIVVVFSADLPESAAVNDVASSAAPSQRHDDGDSQFGDQCFKYGVTSGGHTTSVTLLLGKSLMTCRANETLVRPYLRREENDVH